MRRYEQENLSLTLQGRSAELNARLPGPAAHVLIVLESGRNRPLVNLADVSDRKPPLCAEPEPARPQPVWLPTVDVSVTPRTELVIELSSCAGGAYAWNDKILHVRGKAEPVLRIPSSQLLAWENVLWFEKVENVPQRVAVEMLIPHVPALSRAFRHEWDFLTDAWDGIVTVYAIDGGAQILVGSLAVPPQPQTVAYGTPDRSRPALLNALEGTLRYLLGSQVTDSNSPSKGGFYLFYDLDARTYRNAFWPWGWGPAVRALLDAVQIPEMARRLDPDVLRAAALAAGMASLNYAVDAPGHPADRLSTSRYDPNAAMDGGMRERICLAADGGFLCGWAWIPLYEQTGDARFLNAAVSHAQRVDELCRDYGIPPQDYDGQSAAYTAHTLDESGFGTEAFEGLYRATGVKQYQELCCRYMDLHIEKFRRPDGLWQRAYYRDGDRTEECMHMTRGLGWAM
ncbi:MAG TPA: hypothetical protein PKE04_07425, partial [Clostridia bacterium]|nr:hypothetical protein [Clostridia bacterium]